MSKQYSSTETRTNQLRPINTIPCEVLFEHTYRKSFVTVASSVADPRVCALVFSINGTAYAKSSFLMPISQNLKYDIFYPSIRLSDGNSIHFLRFGSRNMILNLMSIIDAKIVEVYRNKLTVTEIYSTFFEASTSSRIVQNVCKETFSYFNSLFRISKDMYFDDPIAVTMLIQHEKWFRKPHDLNVFVCTWNIDQKDPPEKLDELFTNNYDILVFCFQEIDMTMDCIMSGHSPVKTQNWNEALSKAVTKTQASYIGGMQLGTSYIAAFVKTALIKSVADIQTASVTLGSMGFYNKSAVGISFNYSDTRLCFISAHLSHGRKNVERRNSEFWKIQSEMVFVVQKKKQDGDEIIRYHLDDHDAIFWSGDFNYRLTIPDPESRERFKETNYLLSKDQLITAHKRSEAFVGYNEGEITFPPSYKYDKGTENIDSSSKQRGPAWCDRIFLRIVGEIKFVSLNEYNMRKNFLMSDHRPVYSDFKVKAWESDIQKAQELYKEVQASIRALRWATRLSDTYLDFGTVKFGEQTTRTIHLHNDGQVPVIFYVKFDAPWLNVHPIRGTVFSEQTCELIVSVLIDQRTQNENPLITQDFMKHVTIYYPSGKPPSGFCVGGTYTLSPVGMPLEYLIRLPVPLSEAPPSLFMPNNPEDIYSAPIMSQPIHSENPPEVTILIEELRKIAKDPQVFIKPGKSEDILQVLEILRCRGSLDGKFDQFTVAGALLSLLDDFYTPLIPPERIRAWNHKETSAQALLVSLKPENQSIIRYILMFFGLLFRTLWKNLELKDQILSLFGANLAVRRGQNDESLSKLGIKFFTDMINS